MECAYGKNLKALGAQKYIKYEHLKHVFGLLAFTQMIGAFAGFDCVRF